MKQTRKIYSFRTFPEIIKELDEAIKKHGYTRSEAIEYAIRDFTRRLK